MKILQVGSGIPPRFIGGAEIYMYNLAKELSKFHEVHILYPIYSKTNIRSQVISGEFGDFYVHKFQIPRLYSLKAIQITNTYINQDVEREFKKFLVSTRPEIVHFHNLWRFRSAKLINVAYRLDIPTVITLHDYWFLCPFSTMINYKNEICNMPTQDKCYRCWVERLPANVSIEQLRPFLKFALKIVNSPQDFKKRNEFLKRMLLTVDKIIAPSKFLKEMFIGYGIPKDKIVHIENGYNLDLFKGFRKKKKSTNKVVFGFAGNISPIKGVHILIDAFLKVPEEKAELRIYGDYNQKSTYVKSLFKKIRGRSNIRFLGRYNDPKVPFSEIDVLVVPSIVYETGGPLVIREAFATKTPVIASRIGSIPELVVEEKTGLLFKPRSVEDLYEKILQIIENSELIDKFKRNIAPPKSMKEHATEIVKIYKELLGGAT